MSLFRESGKVLRILQDARALITPEGNFASWQAIDSKIPVDSSGQYVNSLSPAAYKPIREWIRSDALDNQGRFVEPESPAACQWSVWGAIDLAAMRFEDKDEITGLKFRSFGFFTSVNFGHRSLESSYAQSAGRPGGSATVRGPLREGEHDDAIRYVQSATYHRDVLEGLDRAIVSCKKFRRWYSWSCKDWEYPSIY